VRNIFVLDPAHPVECAQHFCFAPVQLGKNANNTGFTGFWPQKADHENMSLKQAWCGL